MEIILIECGAYLALGITAMAGKWEFVLLLTLVGLVLCWVMADMVGRAAQKWVPLLAVGQMLCGVVLLAVTPGVLLPGYLPVAVLHVLLGGCSLFLNAETEAAESPRIQSKR